MSLKYPYHPAKLKQTLLTIIQSFLLPDQIDDLFHMVLAEGEDDKELLDVHLDDGFSEGGSEKRPERDQEMTTSNAGQVKQRVRYLQEKIKGELIQ